jgi:hypothetical protein
VTVGLDADVYVVGVNTLADYYDLSVHWYISSDEPPRRHRWGLVVNITAVVKFGGGARPNPGQAAIGYIVETNSN